MVLKIAFAVTALLIAALHIGSVSLKKSVGEILVYVNLGVHIALVFELMALNVSFEFMALSFTVSLFIYLLSFFAVKKIRERGN